MLSWASSLFWNLPLSLSFPHLTIHQALQFYPSWISSLLYFLSSLTILVQVLVVFHLKYCHSLQICLASFNLLILKSSLYVSTRGNRSSRFPMCQKLCPWYAKPSRLDLFLSLQFHPLHQQLAFKKLFAVPCALPAGSPSVTFVHAIFSSKECPFSYPHPPELSNT